jgi:hypothetical protein
MSTFSRWQRVFNFTRTLNGIFEARGLTDEEQIFPLLDAACAAANRCGRWRNWAFLTLQIQLSDERREADRALSVVESQTCSAPTAEAEEGP